MVVVQTLTRVASRKPTSPGRPQSSAATMVLHNPNNWHWVNKDVSQWAREWFEENLLKVEAKNGDVEARISKVQSLDGDVDVSQRKGKVITIFDVKLVLEYNGARHATHAS